ncbi:hypothetical protein GGI13_008074, partial [Coemansia sp. RSA 455]
AVVCPVGLTLTLMSLISRTTTLKTMSIVVRAACAVACVRRAMPMMKRTRKAKKIGTARMTTMMRTCTP